MSDIKITSNIKEVINGLQDKKKIALEIIGGKAESYAKRLCPVDTGNLRNSITHQQFDENTEIIGTNVEYAPYVELGHRKPNGGHVAPKPYLRPAAENHSEEYKAILKSVMSK